MEPEVKFKYGTWENFQEIQNKDPGTLYFLDNSHVYKGDQLLTNVKTVWNGSYEIGTTDDNGFPDIPDESLRECYIISLENGEIRFVDSDLEYVYITELVLNNVLLNQNFLQQLIAAIADTQEVVMPTLTVNKHTLVWTGSNVDSPSW